MRCHQTRMKKILATEKFFSLKLSKTDKKVTMC